MLNSETGSINGNVRFVELGDYYKFKVDRPYKDSRLMVHINKGSVKDDIINQLNDRTLVTVEGVFKNIGNTKYQYLECKRLKLRNGGNKNA